MSDEEVVYFELDNWFCGRDYPDSQPFIGWMEDLNVAFMNKDWIKENKLCVVMDNVDLSVNFCITATKTWVEQNCPNLLTDYTQFLRFPDKDGCVYGKLTEAEFLPYNNDNIGLHLGDYEENTDYGYIDDDYDGDAEFEMNLENEIEKEFGNMNKEFKDEEDD